MFGQPTRAVASAGEGSMAFAQLAMASTLLSMASTLLAMASNLVAMGSTLLVPEAAVVRRH